MGSRLGLHEPLWESAVTKQPLRKVAAVATGWRKRNRMTEVKQDDGSVGLTRNEQREHEAAQGRWENKTKKINTKL